MKIYIRGRNLRVSEAQRDHVEKQLERLSRHYDRILEAHVTVRSERTQRIVDVTLHLPHYLMKAEERAKSVDEAIDLVRDRLAHQISKYKTRKVDRRHRGNGRLAATRVQERTPAVRIARVKRFELRPMDPQQAALQMEMLGHDFHVFLNSESQEVNVLYRRRGGDLGLIEPIL